MVIRIKNKLTFIDIFAGMGTIRLGMEQAGHKCIYAVEWDKHKRKIYKVIFDHEPEGRDINAIRTNDLPRADAWAFGFPCQDISVAGKQLGFRGNRSSLFFAVTRFIRQLKEEDRPSYLLIENVKNFFSVNRGYDFLAAQIELDEIGYDAEWELLNSKDFGVPQNRQRVFIVGHLRGRSTRKVFPIAETNGVYNPTDLTSGGNDKWNGDYIPSKVPISMTQKNFKKVDIANTLTASGPSKGRGNNSPVNGVMQIGNCMPTKTRDNPNQGRIYNPQGISPCLNKMEGGGREPIVVIPALTTDRLKQNGIMISEATKKGYDIATQGDSINLSVPGSKTRRGRVGKGVANTLDTSCNQGTLEGIRIRRFTPRECMRLQAVPDHITDKLIEAGISDSQIYRAAGDGCTVSVIYEIAKRMELIEC